MRTPAGWSSSYVKEQEVPTRVERSCFVRLVEFNQARSRRQYNLMYVTIVRCMMYFLEMYGESRKIKERKASVFGLIDNIKNP